MEKIFATFIISPSKDGIAAITRVEGGIGLPGGKIEKGENPIEAVKRESREEGWEITGPFIKIVDQFFEGRLIRWYGTTSESKRLKNFKEKGKIEPISITVSDLYDTKYYNNEKIIEFAMKIDLKGRLNSS